MLAAFLFRASGDTFSLVFILSSDGCCGSHCKDVDLTTGISYSGGKSQEEKRDLKVLN